MFKGLLFLSVGKTLFNLGFNNTHSGNISERHGRSILITKTGAMLHKLTILKLTLVSLLSSGARDKKASMELVVHRAIYQAHPHINAIIHAHPPYSIAMARDGKAIIPYDDEGRYFFSTIPVLTVSNTIASNEVAKALPALLHDSPAVILGRHGVFATGENMAQALKHLTIVESVCKINYLLETRHAS